MGSGRSGGRMWNFLGSSLDFRRGMEVGWSGFLYVAHFSHFSFKNPEAGFKLKPTSATFSHLRQSERPINCLGTAIGSWTQNDDMSTTTVSYQKKKSWHWKSEMKLSSTTRDDNVNGKNQDIWALWEIEDGSIELAYRAWACPALCHQIEWKHSQQALQGA